VIGSFIVTGKLIAKVMRFSSANRMRHYLLFSMTIIKSFTSFTMLVPQLVTVISSCLTQLLSMLTFYWHRLTSTPSNAKLATVH